MQSQGSQLQAGDPAFGAGFQRGDIFCGELQTHRLVKKFGGFGRGKAQVGGTQFGQLATGAQTSQRKRRILAGSDDQVHLWRQVLKQKGERIVYWFGINNVIVVKDKDEALPGDGGDFIDQGCQNRFDWR